ncbi:DUF6597 domain-containing transcriptional factor [Anaerosacchariphilus polymeriproducens]|uniref:DUF6597 domain-containing protein n=1 Tax=Anaerosacchariphilus polymeriproducens TaxID=1812858 RepID=A0A371AVV5_9FIRM|nr:DUF6597 domain-containing transcriptional factor [Anaerosacchariphilus polymeriproducens]RDU23706.1 hypothetical protein DWV06_07545 [Anaerosacchariphilus polymeriproducens]
MVIKQFGPPDLLQNLIDYTWVVEPNFLHDEEQIDTIMPLGHINIIFNYASNYMLIKGKKEILIPNAAIIGQIKSAKRVKYGRKLDQIGISLKPAGFSSLFNIPGIAVTERIMNVNEIDVTFHELYHEIKEINGTEEKIKKIYEYLESKMVSEKNSELICEMTTYVECNCENLNIVEMAEFFCISISALERFFKKNVGLTPKTYGDIFKFRKNVEDNVRRKNMQNYYYDQSHLIKKAKKFSGKTVNELKNVKKELTLQHLLNSNEIIDTDKIDQ